MAYGIVIRDGANTPRNITGIQVRDGTNTPRNISQIWVRDASGTPRMVFSLSPPLSLDIAPAAAFGSDGTGSGTATTYFVTATPTGGTGPFTYSWVRDSFDNPYAFPTISSATSNNVNFTQTSIGPGEFYTSQWTCTVTDSLGATAQDSCTASWSGF